MTSPVILIFTQHSLPLARRIAATFAEPTTIFAPAKSLPNLAPDAGVVLYDEPARQRVGALFREGHALVAVASVGLMVRLVADCIQHKAVDPAVVVVDEAGRYVVPMLSGHLGGGNALAERIATQIGAIPVVTTATESLNTVPIDRIAAEAGWRIDDLQTVKAVARSLINDEPVAVVQECGDTTWQQRYAPLPASVVCFNRWEELTVSGSDRPAPCYAAGILISDRIIPAEVLQVVAPVWTICRPPSLVVGVGAERGVPQEELDAAVQQVLAAHGLAIDSVAAVATLDRKAAEEGFGRWLAQRSWPVSAYPAEQLAQVRDLPNPSSIVAQAVGTPGVCEPAAILASGHGMLTVPKQKHGRVTVAVARKGVPAAAERAGRLSIVGIGPGAPELLTVRAIQVLERAEVVVGYERYIEFLGERLAGKDIRGSAIGREIDRALLAIDLARQGRQVALISSGDAGIYGMGGLAFEALENQGWGPDDPLQVEVIPGVSAVQSAASLLGAPLANDFAVLSLSDLMTPRDTIERRLEALAAADIVVALYNPQSQRRRALFQRAYEVFLQYRPSTTPVAVVRAAYREGQSVHLGSLAEMAAMPVDMESLVLIGNSQTHRFADRLVTVRGYNVAPEESRAEHMKPDVLQAEGQEASQATHKIVFVGAGPGDPELLTLRGAKVLREADVVIYAGSLVPRGVLTHVKPGARLHNSAAMTLEDTHRLLTEAYHAGQRVVRLHSGDPSIYGAITEQMALLDEAQIPYDIVPGVSAFQAVAARLGFEYTQPGVVQTLILTRPGGRTGLPANESLAELAKHQVTLCLFLGARHVAEVQETLLRSYAPTTPVAVAYRATWPDEELLTGTLEELTEMVQSGGFERTTLIVVGPSLRRHGGRSRLYDATHWHLFRPEKRRQG